MTLVSLINYTVHRYYPPAKLLQIIERRDFRASSLPVLPRTPSIDRKSYKLPSPRRCRTSYTHERSEANSQRIRSRVRPPARTPCYICAGQRGCYQDSRYTLTLWNFREAIGFRRCPTTGSPSWRIPWSCRSPSSRRTGYLWDDDICKEKERSKLKEILRTRSISYSFGPRGYKREEKAL